MGIRKEDRKKRELTRTEEEAVGKSKKEESRDKIYLPFWSSDLDMRLVR
jgi:hypothetical protein